MEKPWQLLDFILDEGQTCQPRKYAEGTGS